MPLPSRSELNKAKNKGLQDIIQPGLKILFCGINPGLYSAYVSHHFARPGNRFWPALYRSGLLDQPLKPTDELRMLDRGFGLTNIVNRATASAAELTEKELRAGAQQLLEKLSKYKPLIIAFLGVSAYRSAFDAPAALLGKQPHNLFATVPWVLPSPSGLNAHFTPDKLVQAFRELKDYLDQNSDK